MKLTYGDINSPAFTSAMAQIDKCRNLDIETIMHFNRVWRVCMAEVEHARAIYTKLIETHGVTESVNDGGKIMGRTKFLPNGAPVVKDEKLYQEEFKKFLDTEFVIDAPLLPWSIVERVKLLSPSELRAISVLLEAPPWNSTSPKSTPKLANQAHQ